MRLNVENRITHELSPTLRANAGDNQVSVAFCQNQREEVRMLGEITSAINSETGMHQQTFLMDIKK